MYSRGGGSSKPEMVDRRRIINDALDKQLEKSSTSTSRAKDRDRDRIAVPSSSAGKSQIDHRDSRASSLSKNKASGPFLFSWIFQQFGMDMAEVVVNIHQLAAEVVKLVFLDFFGLYGAALQCLTSRIACLFL